MARDDFDFEPLLTSAEVAAMFGVERATVARWARTGRLGSMRTVGGNRRYRAGEIAALLASIRDEPAVGP